jgi:hypothetical protein
VVGIVVQAEAFFIAAAVLAVKIGRMGKAIAGKTGCSDADATRNIAFRGPKVSGLRTKIPR